MIVVSLMLYTYICIRDVYEETKRKKMLGSSMEENGKWPIRVITSQ